MAGHNFKLVPKMSGNKIIILFVVPSAGECRQIASLEVPNDFQLNDNLDFANEVCQAYKKRIRKSIS